MGRCAQQKKLVKAESRQIAGPLIQLCFPQAPDPEIEQRQVAQDAINQIEGERPIRRRKPAPAEQFG
jgi:hypothetical protein